MKMMWDTNSWDNPCFNCGYCYYDFDEDGNSVGREYCHYDGPVDWAPCELEDKYDDPHAGTEWEG